MQLNVSYDFQPKQPSCRAAVVMDHFGVGFETGPFVIAEDLELPIRKGDVVGFTGASGSGKSSLMRAAAKQLTAEGQMVLNLDELDLGETVLIEALKVPVSEAMGILAACGLSEARLLLRTPQELSDGQRYRFRLALAISKQPAWIVADEFSATLDRTLAKVIAFNLRRVADRTGIGFLLATTHEDILADLAPSLSIFCQLDGAIECRRSDEDDPAQKKTADQFHPRHPHHDRIGTRLAAFLWVALPKPSPRLREVHHPSLAWRSAHRHLRDDLARHLASPAKQVLRKAGPLVEGFHQKFERATRHPLASGVASDVSRGGDRGGVHPPKLSGLPLALDRNLDADGPHQPRVRKSRLSKSRPHANRPAFPPRPFRPLWSRIKTPCPKKSQTPPHERNERKKPLRKTRVLHLRQPTRTGAKRERGRGAK